MVACHTHFYHFSPCATRIQYCFGVSEDFLGDSFIIYLNNLNIVLWDKKCLLRNCEIHMLSKYNNNNEDIRVYLVGMRIEKVFLSLVGRGVNKGGQDSPVVLHLEDKLV